MPAKPLVIRYPDGDFEYDFTRRPLPVIGETVQRRGARWRVTRLVGIDVLTTFVERVEQPQHGPPSAPR